MTPLVETARQLVFGLRWKSNIPTVMHAGRELAWRHHGLGMLQAELSEELRIHIWHPKLVSPGMAWPRCVHDHRFDIWSVVVLGEVIDVTCDVLQARVGFGYEPANIYEIEHAKNQDRLVLDKGCSTATSAHKLASGSVHKTSEEVQAAGREYFIPRRTFHTTKVQDLAITVVHRSNFDERLARVLCAPDSDVTAISGIVRDDGLEHRILVNWVLREAGDAIAQVERSP
jgi:hypothetical protein